MSEKKSKKPKIKSNSTKEALLGYVKNSWWTLMVLAILSVILGLYAIFFPGATMEFFIVFFGSFLIIGGVFGIINSFIGDKRFSTPGLIVGALCLIAGIFIVQNPLGFSNFLVYLCAVILLIKSLLNMQLSDKAKSGADTWLIVTGFLGVAASIFLFISPTIGGITVLLILGIYAVVFGIASIIDLINARRKVEKYIKG